MSLVCRRFFIQLSYSWVSLASGSDCSYSSVVRVSFSRVPSVSLIDSRPRDIKQAHLEQNGEGRDSAAGLDGFVQRVVAMRLVTVDLHLREKTEV